MYRLSARVRALATRRGLALELLAPSVASVIMALMVLVGADLLATPASTSPSPPTLTASAAAVARDPTRPRPSNGPSPLSTESPDEHLIARDPVGAFAIPSPRTTP